MGLRKPIVLAFFSLSLSQISPHKLKGQDQQVNVSSLEEVFLDILRNNSKLEALYAVFAPHHGWAIRKVVAARMYALPTKAQLLKKLNEDAYEIGQMLEGWVVLPHASVVVHVNLVVQLMLFDVFRGVGQGTDTPLQKPSEMGMDSKTIQSKKATIWKSKKNYECFCCNEWKTSGHAISIPQKEGLRCVTDVIRLPELENPSPPLIKYPILVSLLSENYKEDDEAIKDATDTRKVTDWRALDKFVASQLSPEEDRNKSEGISNFGTQYNADAGWLLSDSSRDR
ncbi:hypothetical protein IFM89_038272 [Coptis chinensis]|uniref:Glycolipid transfer protein domain-containing protein n=1 Tax=Coptis chinensis TaxID=261450 RepID=A0A835LKU8_9MAGN|nr:hypothetical protein IFM89_038272 [Coptis chinensis]